MKRGVISVKATLDSLNEGMAGLSKGVKLPFVNPRTDEFLARCTRITFTWLFSAINNLIWYVTNFIVNHLKYQTSFQDNFKCHQKRCFAPRTITLTRGACIDITGRESNSNINCSQSVYTSIFRRATDMLGSTRNINLSPSTFSCYMPSSNINHSRSVYTLVIRKTKFKSGIRSINLD